MNTSVHTLLSRLFAAAIFFGATSFALGATVEVYKSSTCKCCAKWVDHMRANGFTVNTNDVGNIALIGMVLCSLFAFMGFVELWPIIGGLLVVVVTAIILSK